jgi:two-component system sensor histidine kinase YesM
MRYLNKFSYEITADRELLSCRTLKLILQPIVENSIYHGIKNMAGKGFIKITAQAEGDKLVICIKDDGVGMDSQALENLLNGPVPEKSSSSSGIGVHNVNERIKLYFGKEYGLRFESSLEKGTTAYIYLPLLYK